MGDAIITMRDVRTAFPRPERSGKPPSPDCYCVGGALLLKLACLGAIDGDYASPFPSLNTLAAGIRVVNARLSMDQALFYAAEIIRQNDMGNFERAWLLLDRALTSSIYWS